MRRLYPDVVIEIIRSLPSYRNLDFLELGCGDGYMLEALSKEGVKAVGTTYLDKTTDYIRSRDHPENIHVRSGIDLNRPLPFADAAFDVVYSMEVIEHIEKHSNFISEAARVLRPGGWFILTTPNLHRLISRLHFAATGVHLVKERRPPFSAALERMGEFHIRCPDFPFLHWLMWQSGLRIARLETEYVHPLSRVALIFSPLLRPLTARALRRYEPPDEEVRAPFRDLTRWMNSSMLLASERICLLARKAASATPSPSGPLGARDEDTRSGEA